MLRSISSEDTMTKERTLAAKLKRGDTAALKEIIDCYAGYVRTVIRNFSRGTFSEQDIDERFLFAVAAQGKP